MNKITTSSKVAIVVTLVVSAIALLYVIFGENKTSKQSPSEQNTPTGSISSDQRSNQNQEIAPIYSDIDSPTPTIQISEDTKSKSQPQIGSGTLPQGFGFVGNQTENSGPNSNETPSEPSEPSGSLEELPIDLETPTDSTVVDVKNADKPVNQNKDIETMDPREVGVTTNDGPDKDYEETVLTVQRTLTAVNPSGEKQLIRLKIPVMYKSKSLRLEGESKLKAQEVLKKLKTKGEELAKLKEELETTLVEWNQLVMTTTPYEVLLPESPTLPQNQSAGRLNREDNPSMSAGKAISYEIINK